MSAAATPPGPSVPPLPQPIFVDEHGFAWLPDGAEGEVFGWYVHEGLRLAWTPIAGFGALVHVLGGPNAMPGFDEEGVLFTLSQDGLRQVAADLLAIANLLDAGKPEPTEPVWMGLDTAAGDALHG